MQRMPLGIWGSPGKMPGSRKHILGQEQVNKDSRQSQKTQLTFMEDILAYMHCLLHPNEFYTSILQVRELGFRALTTGTYEERELGSSLCLEAHLVAFYFLI